MWQYAARRLLAMIPVVLLVTIATAGLIRLAPGDVLVAQMAESGYVDPKNLERIRQEMGLDKPFYIQYMTWLGDVLKGDLGTSIATFRKARNEIFRVLPLTIQLAMMATLLGFVVSVPIGLYSAVRQDTAIDYIARVVAIIGVAAPQFWTATLFIVFAAVWFGYFPPHQYTSFIDNPLKNLETLIFPTIILGLSLSAVTTRMIRSSTLEVIRQDYIRTAWAKGLSERMVIARHVLKNAFIPVITIVGAHFTYLLGGTIIIEVLFNLPGMGRLTWLSISQRDYVQLQANVLVFATMVVIMNLIVDISYAWFDPKIRYS